MSRERLHFVAALLYVLGPFTNIVLSNAVFRVRGDLKYIISFTARSCVDFGCCLFISNRLFIATGAMLL